MDTGVEREFSKSGHVASWTRNAGTISEIMLFKISLASKGDAISACDDVSIEVGIADEIVNHTDVVKRCRQGGIGIRL